MKIDDFTRLISTNGTFIKPERIITPESNLRELGCISNKNWNDNFEWGPGWPEDMDERMKEWYETPFLEYMNKNKK